MRARPLKPLILKADRCKWMAVAGLHVLLMRPRGATIVLQNLNREPSNMLLAVIGHVHGNAAALRAALAEINDEGIETVLNTGDSVVGGPEPGAVIDALIARGVVSVQGVADRLAVRYTRKRAALEQRHDAAELEAVKWAHEHLSADHLEYLQGLPRQRVLEIENVRIHLCHGVPSSQSGSLDKESDVLRFQRERELANTPLILFGREHRPFARWVDFTLFVNPGSVGAAQGLDGVAQYALIDTDEEPWTVEFKQARVE